MGKRRGLILLFLVSLAAAGCSSGDATEEAPKGPPIAFEECVNQARGIDVEGRRKWHDRLFDYVVENAEQFEEIAGARRDYQHALVDLEQARLDYLLKNDPGRIVTNEGLAMFRKPAWTEEDSAAMAAIHPELANLEKIANEMQEASKQNPQVRVFAEFFNVKLAKSRSYGKLVDVWQSNDEKVEALLDRCLPYEATPTGE